MGIDGMETATAEQPMQSGKTATPLLELRDVNKQYGLNKVLNNVSFHVDRAEILALLGDNGAGKSTTRHATLEWQTCGAQGAHGRGRAGH